MTADDYENDLVAEALRDAGAKVRGVPQWASGPAEPVAEARATSFDGGARGSTPAAEDAEDAHQRLIADVLMGGG